LADSGGDGCDTGRFSFYAKCIIYRTAAPNQPFGPKSTITVDDQGVILEQAVAANRAGNGWVAWTREATGSTASSVEIQRLAVTSQRDLGGGKTIRLVTPTECINSRAAQFTASVRTAGAGIRVRRVSYVSDRATVPYMVPYLATQTRAPFSQSFRLDKRLTPGRSPRSTQRLIADVRYRLGAGPTKQVLLIQEMSFNCPG
jgi:hypothetical protein